MKLAHLLFRVCKYIGWFRGAQWCFEWHTQLWEQKWRKLFPNSELLESLSKVSHVAKELGDLL